MFPNIKPIGIQNMHLTSLNLLSRFILIFFYVPYDNFLNSIGYSTIVMSMSNVIHLETFTASPRYVFLTYVAK